MACYDEIIQRKEKFDPYVNYWSMTSLRADLVEDCDKPDCDPPYLLGIDPDDRFNRLRDDYEDASGYFLVHHAN